MVFDWVRDLNRRLADNSLATVEATDALAAWERIDTVLAVGAKPDVAVPEEIIAMMNERQAARKAKDFKRADKVRDDLKANGWIIEDTPKGPRLKRL